MFSETARIAKMIFRQKKHGVLSTRYIELINDVLILIDSYFEAKEFEAKIEEGKDKIQKQKQEKKEDKNLADCLYDCYD